MSSNAANTALPEIAPFGGSADVIVVGSGSAGCVVAARTSEDRSTKVLLLEAGSTYEQDSLNELTDLYGGKVVMRPDYYWPGLKATVASNSVAPGGRAGQAVFKQPRLVGGGASVNGQQCLRGAPDDFDAWVRLGAKGWGWNEVLPYFKKLERDHDFAGDLHGCSGPVSIRRTPLDSWDTVSLKVREVLTKLGHREIDDLNGEFAAGHGPLPQNNDGMMRSSTWRAYLPKEVRSRDNLRIVAETQVIKVRTEGRQVKGVEAIKDGRRVFIPGRRVVLCASAVFSPVILMHSGIGAADELRRLGIEVVCDRPGVGRNFQNHPITSISAYTDPRKRGTLPTRRAIHYTRYSSNVPECDPVDMVMVTGARSMWHAVGERMCTLSTWVGLPYSIGTVRLPNADPASLPVVEANCLSDERDLRRLREGFRLAARVMLEHLYPTLISEPFPTYFSKRIQRLGEPTRFNEWLTWAGATLMDASAGARNFLLNTVVREGPTLRQVLASDKALDEFLGKTVGLAWHSVGTCRMGDVRDPNAVVDSSCAVVGVDGLYVADTSVMPRITRTNTMLPAIMIGERVADFLRESRS